MERMNPDLIAYSLALCGMTSYRATVLEIVQKINEIQEHVEDLESLMSGEIMAGLAQPAELREVVAELGSGWKIERPATPPNGDGATSEPYPMPSTTAGVTADSWLAEADWVTQFAAAADGR